MSSVLVLSNVADLEFADGNPDHALRSISDALEIVVRAKDANLLAVCYVNGAAYRIALGDLAGARESAREGLRIARQARFELGITVTLQHLALLAGLAGECQRAAQILGYVDARYTELGNNREQTEQWGYDKLLVALRETLSEDEIAQLAAEGAAWSEDHAVEEALKV